MSDNARLGFTDKAEAKLKPDSQKTTTEHLGDQFKGNADSAASTVQPQSQKSTTQKAGDALSSNSDNSNHTERSFVDKTKSALGMGGSH